MMNKLRNLIFESTFEERMMALCVVFIIALIIFTVWAVSVGLMSDSDIVLIRMPNGMLMPITF